MLWVILIVVLVILLLLLWRWLTKREEAQKPGRAQPPAAADDLQRIEGIGPKIAQVLADAGITTFAKLAKTSAQELHRLLKDAGLAMADPETWPQQAQLARDGRWEELDKLQEELKGGRRE